MVASGRASGIELFFTIRMMKVHWVSSQVGKRRPRSRGRCLLNACVCGHCGHDGGYHHRDDRVARSRGCGGVADDDDDDDDDDELLCVYP